MFAVTESTCDYYYIFIQIQKDVNTNTNVYLLGLLYHYGSTIQLLSKVPINSNIFTQQTLLSIYLTPDTNIFPTNNPSFNPSINPSNTVITTTKIKEFEIVFALVLITVNMFEFDYMFEFESIGNIINILKRITNKLIINECGYSFGFDSWGYENKNNNTNINANIITCDISYSSTFIKNINNLNFQNELIISIKQEIGMHIIFKQNAIIKYKTLNSNNNNTNTTTLLPTIAPILSSHINTQSTHKTKYSYISWMLKFILVQLGLCCILIFCYFGLKIRTKKLKVNKLAIQEQIQQEKGVPNDQMNNNNSTDNININQLYDININSPKIEGAILDNDDDGNAYGINKHNQLQSEILPLSPTDNYKIKDGYNNVYEIKQEEQQPKYTNYYIKQLMNVMIANKDVNIDNFDLVVS